MGIKVKPVRCLWIVIIFFGVGCGTAPSTEIACLPTDTPSPTISTPPQTSPNLQTPTTIPTETPLPTPISSAPFNLERLRLVYVEEGNLFTQNGTNPPIQLTDSGRDQNPIISADGEKIVFYRGDTLDTVFSINADGSQEQLIIKSEELPTLGQGRIQALTFVPNSINFPSGTHYLLFNTFLCNPSPQGPSYNATDCTVGLFSVDADTGEINQLITGLSGNTLQKRNFEISPDGKMLSVVSSGYLDIYFLSSTYLDIIYQNAILYDRTIPDEYLPHVYWLPDSSGLIAVVATDQYNEPTTPPKTYAVWRYTVNEGVTTQIPLTKTIMFNSGCNFSVSPDRNWIYFNGSETDEIWGEPTQYLSNLNDGQTQPYTGGTACPSTYDSSPKWSSDGRYFTYSGYASTGTIGDVDGSPIPFSGQFLDWVDSSHYIYQENNETYIREIEGESIALPDGFRWSSTFVILELDMDN